jgi:uncharacterized membrane protein YphA (DoxX/SURF4 family)
MVVGGAALYQGAVCLTQGSEQGLLLLLAAMLAAVSGPAVLAGFLTPLSAPAAGLTTLLVVSTGTAAVSPMGIGRHVAMLVVVNGVALALLGPGALSLDARLFGRREIVVPPNPER